MKKIHLGAVAGLAAATLLGSENFNPADHRDLFPAEYWKVWTPEIQQKIDADIIQNRQSDGVFALGAKPGSPVEVKQLNHAFEFGAQSFSFDQFPTAEQNARYRALWGQLFNSATIPFYWREMEPVPGELHTDTTADDCPEFWAKTPNRTTERFWRRPAPLPIIRFCDEHHIRKHGHPIFWAKMSRNIPDWVIALYPAELRTKDADGKEQWVTDLTADQLAARYPEFTAKLNALFQKHVIELAKKFDGKLDSWDVVNEATEEMRPTPDGTPRLIPGAALCPSKYGPPMPGDYVARTFALAAENFQNRPQFHVNDWAMCEPDLHYLYANLIRELRQRGCQVDAIGCQMHILWRSQMEKVIAAQLPFVTPQGNYQIVESLREFDLPIRISEITIPALSNSPEDEAIQAVVAYNLYRLWFSLKPVSGIVWWNLVDFQGASKEQLASGILRRDMSEKPVYRVLDQLINHEWKTNLTLTADAAGKIAFRGFRGQYEITYTNADGKRARQIVELK